jgi:hypothetical protein
MAPKEPKQPRKPREPKRPKKPGFREIFNTVQGIAKMLEAIEAVITSKRNRPWIARAIHASYHVLYERPFLTADDFWEACWKANVEPPDERRAMAGVTSAFQRDGLIESTKDQRESNMVSCHRRRKTVWRSCVFVRRAL